MAQERRIVETKEVILTVPIMKAPRWFQGFLDFIREQGVVGLAVGLTLGIASKSVVDSLVNNIFNPVIGVISGGDSLASKYVCLKATGATCSNKLGYGQLLSDILSFVIVAGVVYFVVKGLKLDRLDKPKEKAKK